jgi:uncharacterized protein
LRAICDTGPLLAAANKRDPAQRLAAGLLATLGRGALIPEPVLVETDHLLRARIHPKAARKFLDAVSQGEHQVIFLTPALLRRAVEIDARYADLDLGLADATVMACAERLGVRIFTFDFRNFRAASPNGDEWRLLVNESQYREATDR